MPHLSIRNLNATYGQVPVLRNFSLSIEKGEVISLIGPSGSGKSTLLRTLMGLTKPTSGEVTLHGQAIDYSSKKSLRAARDRMAIVFQQYNLFQNMTVMGNITIAPIKIRKRNRREVEAEAALLLEKVGLADKHHAYADELSGGQQQRVAIARALALKPEILLLDEVTSALDPELVGEVLDVIRGLAEEGMTMVLVTHEMAFAHEVARTVAFMSDGGIVEIGRPEEVMVRPQNPRTRAFLARFHSSARALAGAAP